MRSLPPVNSTGTVAGRGSRIVSGPDQYSDASRRALTGSGPICVITCSVSAAMSAIACDADRPLTEKSLLTARAENGSTASPYRGSVGIAATPPARMAAAASATDLPRRMRRSEANLHVFLRCHVDAFDEADAMRVVLHDHRARADAVAEKSHALHERPVGDARRGEDDVLAGREILRVVDHLEIRAAPR